ncbi:MAG: hypothetical protein ACOVJ8_01515 [Sediminibacterium sp.]
MSDLFGFIGSGSGGGGGTIGGGGTLNYLCKFTPDGVNIGNSQLFDNGTNVGLGTNTPTSKLHVYNSVNDFLYEVKVENPNGGVSAASSILIQSNSGKLEFGQLSSTHTTYIGYGQLSDTFIRSGVGARNLNVITDPSNTGKILFWSRLNPTTDAAIPSLAIDGQKVGFGLNTPTATAHIKGVDATSSNFALKVENSASAPLLYVRNDGVIDAYGTITPRLQSVVSSAVVTPTNLNDEVVITAQAVGLTLVNPTGTAVQGQSMIIRIKDNGTAQTIAYDTQYRAIGVTLPTTTVISKTLYLGLIYNSTDTKWDIVGVAQEV